MKVGVQNRFLARPRLGELLLFQISKVDGKRRRVSYVLVSFILAISCLLGQAKRNSPSLCRYYCPCLFVFFLSASLSWFIHYCPGILPVCTNSIVVTVTICSCSESQGEPIKEIRTLIRIVNLKATVEHFLPGGLGSSGADFETQVRYDAILVLAS